MTEGHNHTGFTLVEVLVALSVFSLSAIGLVHLTSESTRGAKYIDMRVLAKIEADNQLSKAVLNASTIRPGAQTGTTQQRNQSLSWERTVTPTVQSGLLAVTVSIRDPETGQQLVQRHTLVSRTASR